MADTADTVGTVAKPVPEATALELLLMLSWMNFVLRSAILSGSEKLHLGLEQYAQRRGIGDNEF